MSSLAVRRVGRLVVQVVLAPVWIPVMLAGALIGLPILGFYRLIRGLWLLRLFQTGFATQGKRVVLQYSRSPIWQSYIEEYWLPRLGQQVVVVDWSDHAKWKRQPPLAARIASFWGGDRDFNPLAVVFTGRGKPKVVRFYKEFIAFKHGKPAGLREAEDRLFSLVEQGGV